MPTYHIESPLNRTQRNNVNETFADILSKLISLQRQIFIITGEIDVNQLIVDTERMIQESIDRVNASIEQNTQMTNDLLVELRAELVTVQQKLEEIDTATNATVEATTQANSAINLIDNLISSFVYRGQYDSSTTYEKNNLVTSVKSTYIALKTQTGIVPTDNGIDWSLFAAAGVDGTGAVSTVNGVAPQPDGNVILDVVSKTEYDKHIRLTEVNYNLLEYMENGVSAYDAFQNILSLIGRTGVRAVIYLPTGYYDLSAITTSISLPSQLTIKGDGHNTSLILVNAGELFTIGTPDEFVNGVSFEDLQFRSFADPQTNQVCVGIRNGGDVVFNNVEFGNVATILDGGDINFPCHGVKFSNIKGYTNNLGRPAFILNNGTGFLIDGRLFVNGTITPTHGQMMNTVEGTDLIRVTGSWDTIDVYGTYERFYNGFNCDTNGKIVQNITLRGIFDYIRNSCVSVRTTGGGALTGLKIVDSWIFCWEGDSVRIANNAGVICRGISVVNCDIACSGVYGINFSGVKNFNISNNRISGVGQVDGNNNAIFITTGNSNFSITGNVTSYAPETGIDWGATPWIYVAGDNDFYNINDNNVFGCLLLPNTTNSKNRLISNNVQWGNAPDVSYNRKQNIVIPASGVPYTNNFGFVLDIYIYGEIESVSKENVNVALSSTSVNLKLYPGEAITINRTASVDWSVFGLA